MSAEAALLSLLATVAAAGMTLVNEWAKQPGAALLVWRGLIPPLLLAPCVTLIGWPENPLFYLYIALGAGFAALFDGLNFAVAARYGAGVATRLMPVSVWLILLGWAVIVPASLLPFLSEPVRGAAALLALAALVWGASRLRKSAIDRAAITLFWPALPAAAIVQILNKLAMDLEPSLDAALAYAAFQSGLMALFGFGFLLRHGGAGAVRRLFSGKLLFASALVAGFLIAHLLAKNLAFIRVDNPTWVTAILLSAPLFVLGVYRLIGRREAADWRSGLIVVAATAILILAAP